LGLSEDGASEAADLTQQVRNLPALAAVRTADVVHREMPIVYQVNGKPVAGRIDLAYRVAGTWTLIDFKTARLPSAADAHARFGAQLGRYETGLRALTGERASVSLCLMRTGELVHLETQPPTDA
jgi:ATP-dependent exoDNAse (exonuclease V) beta subunit